MIDRSIFWCILAYGLMLPPNALSKDLYPERDAIEVTPGDPGRKCTEDYVCEGSAKNGKNLAKEVIPVNRGKRGAKRKPRAFKKITTKRLIQLTERSLKAGARGARGAKLKSARERLKAGKFTLSVDASAWAGPNATRKGARGKARTTARKKTLSQAQILAELNILEKAANKQGYSLLDNPDKEEVFETKFEDGEADLERQYKADAKEHAGVDRSPLVFRRAPAFASVQHSTRARGKAKSFLRMVKPSKYSVGKRAKTKSRGAGKAAVKTYTPKVVVKKKSFSGAKAKVTLEHRLERTASEEQLRVHSRTSITGKVFGVKVISGWAESTFTARPHAKTVSAKIRLKNFGQAKVVVLNVKGKKVKGDDIYKKAARKKRHRQKSTKIRFGLGPIPCSVEIGASYSMGIEYRVALTPYALSLDIAPFINADAFARFAVDLGVAAAGIEGRVTLIDAELRTEGELGHAVNSKKKLIAYDFFVGTRATETLGGKLSAFAKVGLGFCCNKTWKHKILGWRGKQRTVRLYRLDKEARLVAKKKISKLVFKKRRPVGRTKPALDPRGKWGSNGDKGACPPGSYAYAFKQKILPKQGKKRDDLGLTGLNMLCRTPGGVKTKMIWSETLGEGSWSDWAECPKGEAFIGYRIKIEGKQGKKRDDTAANEVELVCGDGTKLNPKVKNAGRWGKWKTGPRCKRGGRISNFKVIVEKSAKDGTGVNGIVTGCTAFDKGEGRPLGCRHGANLEGERCRAADIDLNAFSTECAATAQCGCGLYVGKKSKDVYVRCFARAYNAKGRGATSRGLSRSSGKGAPPPPPMSGKRSTKSAPKAPPKPKYCPPGWMYKESTLTKNTGQKQKRKLCLRKVTGLRKKDATRCSTATYNPNEKPSKAAFHFKHACDYWLDSKRKGIFTYPEELFPEE